MNLLPAALLCHLQISYSIAIVFMMQLNSSEVRGDDSTHKLGDPPKPKPPNMAGPQLKTWNNLEQSIMNHWSKKNPVRTEPVDPLSWILEDPLPYEGSHRAASFRHQASS
ncbi:unnamed protein product [Dovyalis caffra]|uniref:Uncharacterized protein n=1 Tax=Dovyalis caffra TaxID=77055 RepID=A0AAV1R7G1_9ROSI|nr:unnamed protein product [Dovyalis caffra]